MADPTRPSALKLARAHEHLVGLKEAIKRFEESDPAMMVADFRPGRPGHNIRYVVVEPVPAHFGPWVGDVIYNLRAALDYAVYELTIAHTGRALTDTGFPICRTRQAWDQRDSRTESGYARKTGRHKLRGVHPEIRAMIRQIQPFRKKGLWPMAWLDDLYNIDKHRTLHLLATFPPDGSAHLVLRNGTGVVHQVMYRRRPEHDAVMGRITYTKGTVEGDVDVDLEQASKVAFDEAFPGQKTYSVSAALEVFQTDIVGLIFERFEPYFAPHPHRTSPVKE